MYNRKKILIPFILFILIMSGCTNTTETVEPNTESEKFDEDLLPMAKGEQGFSLGLYNNENIESKRTFNISSNNFTKNIVFGNKTSEKGNFKLLVFNHGKQIEFYMDGKEYTYFDFTLTANQYSDLQVTLKDISNGFQSINYIVIREPNLAPDNLENALVVSQLYSIRVNLLKNIKTIPKEKPNLTNISKTNKKSKIHGVFVSELASPYTAWLKENISKKTDILNYNIVYGNKENSPVDFYLVTMVNWNQVPISDKQLHIYDQLKVNEEKSIQGKLDHNLLNKEKNIFVTFMLPDPYKELPDKNPHGAIPAMSSIRTSITQDHD
ncbi:hypothetical protein [Metabacillus niabensis]|uniref:hypothetical protein n=1 Tax=Metabacillus niabensis TaxID=324854 RepID=UPI001CFA77F8|nr:hypothetical protein [Metabacillus niabensis]